MGNILTEWTVTGTVPGGHTVSIELRIRASRLEEALERVKAIVPGIEVRMMESTD